MRKYVKIAILFLLVLVTIDMPVIAAAKGISNRDTVSESLSVEEQIRDFARSIHCSGMDNDAAWALAKHGISGQGKPLTAGKNHALTGTLMNSELALATIIRGCQMGIDVMQQIHLDSVYDDGGCNWGADRKYYTNGAYLSASHDKGELLYRSAVTDLSVPANTYDSSLTWMAGSMEIHTSITQAESTLDTITYDVQVVFEDRFDFEGNGGSTPAEFASLLGSILFKEFDWTASVEFSLTVPNYCGHTSSSYHWCYDAESEEMHCAESTEFTENRTTKYAYTKANKVIGYYYQLDQTVVLRHDVPWELEYAVKNPGHFAIAPTQKTENPYPCLMTYETNHLFFQKFQLANNKAKYHCYGYTFANLFPYSKDQVYTIHLENVIQDGGNRIYVSVFNQDAQKMVLEPMPMDDYYWNVDGVLQLQDKESKELNGVDLRINYIGNHGEPFRADYFELKIWENGKNGASHDYCTYSTIAPSHDSTGRQTIHCSLCGGTTVNILPESHDEKFLPGYAPTCTQAGLSEGAVCITCGKTVRKQEKIPALGHQEKIIPGTVTCTDPGLTAGVECTRCEQILVSQTQREALGHAWDQGVVITPMTCTTPGEMRYTCIHDASHSYVEEIPAAHKPVPIPGYAPSCTKIGLTDASKCGVCGTVLQYHQSIPATGHSETIIAGKEATCTEPGFSESRQCTVCNLVTTEPQEIAARGHVESIDEAVNATCTETGLSEGVHCSVCAVVLMQQKEIPALGHTYADGACIRCGARDPGMPVENVIRRISGSGRCQTAIEAALELKKIWNLDKFRTMIVADGNNYPDALSGSYLAATAQAPILLLQESQQGSVMAFIENNLAEEGMLYILGGTNSVSEVFESSLLSQGIKVQRIAGKNRYDTSLRIIEEADRIKGERSGTILVCDGNGYADSLSASATGLPVLLVKGDSHENYLTGAQKDYLKSIPDVQIYVIGGVNSIRETICTDLSSFDADGNAIRLHGPSREETSVAVAKRFFTDVNFAVFANAGNYPDGLSGGPVAFGKKAPLLLVREGREAAAKSYIGNAITCGYILGGKNSVSDACIRNIFGESCLIS